MVESSFRLKVDGKTLDALRLECHFQSDPYPGGHHYELIIGEAETLLFAKKEFGIGVSVNIGESKSRNFLSFIGGIKSITIGRENPPLFWANTIEALDVSDNWVILSGICSRHVKAEKS